jgi:organic hydroperoxide reductase OsmC/OhrA
MKEPPASAHPCSMMVDCKMLDGSTAHAIIEKANEVCMANSLGRGIPVKVRTTA